MGLRLEALSGVNNNDVKVCSINFEPPDIDLGSACHVYPLFHGAWIFQYYLY